MMKHTLLGLIVATWMVSVGFAEDAPVTKALIDGQGPGWKSLGEDDFTNVNCDEDTWQWKDDGTLYCTGTPIGVNRSVKPYKNFELVLQWRHLKPAGNSGVFVWAPKKYLDELKPNSLPHGIEVQVLENAFTEQYEKRTGKKGDWFTTHGDVFPVRSSTMKPFEPTSPNGSRSFPTKNLSKPSPAWNHYYIRCINSEIRLWVNGEEVSGGSDCSPAEGYLCLESEGSPIEFRNLRLRELPK